MALFLVSISSFKITNNECRHCYAFPKYRGKYCLKIAAYIPLRWTQICYCVLKIEVLNDSHLAQGVLRGSHSFPLSD